MLAWLWLQLLQSAYPGGKQKKGAEQEGRAMRVIQEKYAALGSISLHELQVLVLFIVLILLWFFKTPIFMPGWGDLFSTTTHSGNSVTVGSATPAIFMSILLFILPQTYNFWPFAPLHQSLQNAPPLITWRLIETKAKISTELDICVVNKQEKFEYLFSSKVRRNPRIRE